MTIYHLITPEYPPKIGGVGDYTRHVARGLAAVGDEVHVWYAVKQAGTPPTDSGVNLHPALADLGTVALQSFERQLARFPRPRRLLVQWVAPGYGWRSMNIPFAWLLNRRAQRGDELHVMFHETFQDFTGLPHHHVMAGVQRLMAAILLRAADRVWCSTPTWFNRLKRYSPRDTKPYWLPIPSNVPGRPPDLEDRKPFGVGHFGTYSPHTAPLLDRLLPPLLERLSRVKLLLIGKGSDSFRAVFISRHPHAADRIAATGALSLDEIRERLHQCEVMLQPVLGGVTVRNASVLAALANGRPVVANMGPLTEPCWAEGQTAILVPEHPPSSVAEVVERLLSDQSERNRLAQVGRAWYDQVFDLRHTLAALRAE